MAETGLTMSDAVDSVRGAVRDVFETGKGLVSDLMAAAGSAQLPSMSLGCACARPAACWLPEVLPPVHSTVCAGSVARVRFTVHNCGLGARSVMLAATGPGAGLAVGNPSTAVIEPFGSAVLEAEVTAPASGDVSLTLWIRGCHDHITNWIVTASGRSCDSTHERVVNDCPETQHRWYDHFAQPHACPGQRG